MSVLTSPMSKAKLIALHVFTATQLGDMITTLIFTTRWGTEMEGNPLMRWVLENWGAGGFIALKLGVIAAMWGLRNHIATWIPVAASIMMVPVLYMNSVVAFM